MKHAKILLCFIIVLLMTACNNAADSKESKYDSSGKGENNKMAGNTNGKKRTTKDCYAAIIGIMSHRPAT